MSCQQATNEQFDYFLFLQHAFPVVPLQQWYDSDKIAALCVALTCTPAPPILAHASDAPRSLGKGHQAADCLCYKNWYQNDPLFLLYFAVLERRTNYQAHWNYSWMAHAYIKLPFSKAVAGYIPLWFSDHKKQKTGSSLSSNILWKCLLYQQLKGTKSRGEAARPVNCKSACWLAFWVQQAIGNSYYKAVLS